MTRSRRELGEDKRSAVWCVAATIAPSHAPAPRAGGALEPGTVVYCFPPNTSGAYESVKVIGYDRRRTKFVESVIAANDLTEWRAQPIRDRDVLRHVAPPWDATETSHRVAKAIAAWKSGGPPPTAELREWNRSRAQTQVGPGSILKRVGHFLSQLLGNRRA